MRFSATPSKLVLLPLLLGYSACLPSIANRTPLGETFPTVEGENLAGEKATLPLQWRGEPTLVFVGYKRASQFDIDRWLLGAAQAELKVNLVELPTVGGLFATTFEDRLNESMRRGIPQPLWPSVITIYDEADTIYEWLGTERPNNARTLLLSAEGHVLWYTAEGYSSDAILEIEALLNKVSKADPTKESVEIPAVSDDNTND